MVNTPIAPQTRGMSIILLWSALILSAGLFIIILNIFGLLWIIFLGYLKFLGVSTIGNIICISALIVLIGWIIWLNVNKNSFWRGSDKYKPRDTILTVSMAVVVGGFWSVIFALTHGNKTFLGNGIADLVSVWPVLFVPMVCALPIFFRISPIKYHSVATAALIVLGCVWGLLFFL